MATSTRNAAAPATRAPARPSTAPRSAPATRKAPAATKATADPGPAKAATPVSVPDKEPKARKPKLVRDSFTIPKDEYAVIDALKLRAAALSHPAKKSELLRAGLKALAGMPDAALRAALVAVPAIKTGRPKSER